MTKKELKKIETELLRLGYRKYNQNINSSDYQFWKSFKDYSVGVLVYDFTKFDVLIQKEFSIQYECMLNDMNCRIDMAVKKDINISEFERMSLHFYETMKDYA